MSASVGKVDALPFLPRVGPVKRALWSWLSVRPPVCRVAV